MLWAPNWRAGNVMNTRIAVGHATQYPANDRAGYSVSSRIGVVAPRARWGRATAGMAAADRTDTSIEVTTIELIGRPRNEAMTERMATLRETFAQTTFFLFDANSWR